MNGFLKNTLAEFVVWAAVIGAILYLLHKVRQWFETKQKRHIPTYVKEAVLKRYFGMCAVCPETQLLEYHHRMPYAKGGDNSEKNIVPVCPKHHGMVTRLG